MLTINSKMENNVKTIRLEGILDTLSSMDLDKQLDELLGDTDHVIIDLKGLDYITSAGLRILLQMQNAMNAKGSMKIINVNETIMEIFEVTGFTGVLTIE